jgi:hypothetical protein
MCQASWGVGADHSKDGSHRCGKDGCFLALMIGFHGSVGLGSVWIL